MNPARLFALQTTRVPVNDGARGGIPYFTPALAALYCQDMPEHWYMAAKLKWGADWSGANQLEYRLWDAAVRLKNAERWRIDKKYHGQEMLRRLAGLALYEMADPSRFKSRDAWQFKAAWMHVDKSAWFKTWRPRYEAVYAILNEWTNDAWRYVQKQNARDEMDECV